MCNFACFSHKHVCCSFQIRDHFWFQSPFVCESSDRMNERERERARVTEWWSGFLRQRRQRKQRPRRRYRCLHVHRSIYVDWRWYVYHLRTYVWFCFWMRMHLIISLFALLSFCWLAVCGTILLFDRPIVCVCVCAVCEYVLLFLFFSTLLS